MDMETLECDYLVIGAGAMGMAFADELLTRTSDYTVLMVDKHAQAGGHWNDAYPYVRLHQPSHFYGVNSKKLERAPPRPDGYNELASSHEVVAYFNDVLLGWKDTGRLRFMPKCEVDASGCRVTSLVEPGRSWEVKVRRKVVDSTYMKVEVPSTTAPKYAVAPGALLVPPNSLPSIAKPYSKYIVIGAGKTGIDAVVWLLTHGVAPERLQWVMPRDPWLWARKLIQPHGRIALDNPEVAKVFFGLTPRPKDRGEEALRKEALQMEKLGLMMRVDESVWPEAFQCATVSDEEIEQLRRIKQNIIRMGRVQEVGVDRLLLDRGEVPTGEGTLHVDCTADALSKRPAVPIFAGARITLQSISMCQQVASAAMLAYVESQWPDDDAKKNAIEPVPHPDSFRDWLLCEETMKRNNQTFLQHGGQRWISRSRLSLASHFGFLFPFKFAAVLMYRSYKQKRAAKL